LKQVKEELEEKHRRELKEKDKELNATMANRADADR